MSARTEEEKQPTEDLLEAFVVPNAEADCTLNINSDGIIGEVVCRNAWLLLAGPSQPLA